MTYNPQSNHKGVRKSYNRWQVFVTAPGLGRYYLGSYDSYIQACRIYDEAISDKEKLEEYKLAFYPYHSHSVLKQELHPYVDGERFGANANNLVWWYCVLRGTCKWPKPIPPSYMELEEERIEIPTVLRGKQIA